MSASMNIGSRVHRQPRRHIARAGECFSARFAKRHRMRELFNKLISILDRRQRRQLRAVAAAILAMGLIEVIGISSVLPFMAVVANPEIIHTSASLHTVYTVLGFSGSKTFL